MSKVTIGQVFLMDENDAKELEYRIMKQSVAAYEKEHGVSTDSDEGKARLDKYEEANKPLDKVKQMAVDILRVPMDGDYGAVVANMMADEQDKIAEAEGEAYALKFCSDVADEIGRVRDKYILIEIDKPTTDAYRFHNYDKKEESK